jgi:hypothetical protein
MARSERQTSQLEPGTGKLKHSAIDQPESTALVKEGNGHARGPKMPTILPAAARTEAGIVTLLIDVVGIYASL